MLPARKGAFSELEQKTSCGGKLIIADCINYPHFYLILPKVFAGRKCAALAACESLTSAASLVSFMCNPCSGIFLPFHAIALPYFAFFVLESFCSPILRCDLLIVEIRLLIPE